MTTINRRLPLDVIAFILTDYPMGAELKKGDKVVIIDFHPKDQVYHVIPEGQDILTEEDFYCVSEQDLSL